MTLIFTLLQLPSAYLDEPQGWVGWIGFVLLLGAIIWLIWQWRGYNHLSGEHQRNFLVVLIFGALFASLFIGVLLPAGDALPSPERAVDSPRPVIMIFCALPWILAAGAFGPLPAAGLALLANLPRALWVTHSPFTPLEFALLAVVFSVAVRQRYRTPTFRLLRLPIVAAALSVLLYTFLFLLTTPWITQGVLVSRLDYALSNLPGVIFALASELLIAAVAAHIVARVMPDFWVESGRLEPSPAERSLQTRLLINLVPLAMLLVFTLTAGDWIVAGQAARAMLDARMASAGQVAAENVPYFLEAGQNLIRQLATDPNLLSDDVEALTDVLAQDIRMMPFFNQLSLYNSQGQVIASYPTNYFTGSQLPYDVQTGLRLALDTGVPFQYFTIPPTPTLATAQVAFVATLLDENQTARGVLIGHSDLESNPFTQPILNSLKNLEQIDGQGMLLDDQKRILVHPDVGLLMTTYSGEISDKPLSYDGTASDGKRLLVYTQPAEGRPWHVVLTVPAYRAQQLALDIAVPLLGMILALSIVAYIVLRLGLRVVTASLQNLAAETGQLALGRLDRALLVEGDDEVGHLRRAFEQMRVSLKARLDELNRLLLVSQGVASSLEVSEAVQPILESALATGASMVRVVLTPAVVPGLDGGLSGPVSFGLGPAQNLYKELDEQILALTRQQERLVLPNLSRPRLLTFAPGAARPESLLAIALRHENQYYGTLWVAYDQPHAFSEEEVRFMATLGGQAALAAANARLFLNAEIGRQRLAAILASSPDPVLVTDQRDGLLLANPAAWQALGLGIETDEGQPIDQVISQSELVDLLRSAAAEKQSREVTLPDGRVYLATATSVLAEGQRMGRVCVLRDVTHFKELDALKSDFVATVSHDLRSPLTLMRGYATMLEMVGQLNEQQNNYVRKIISGVESMSLLVNSLLDLGRIEAGVGLQLEMIPVQDIVERVVGALQLQAAQKHIQITTDPLGRDIPPLIEGDQALLQQALHNLVENAIKYTRPEGKVSVRVRMQPVGMVFEVMDTGIGVSPVDLPRLFEKFYRGAQQAAKEQRGTGLGLAIVKSIAERHGGTVWVESELGKGSIFRMAVPVRQPRREPET